MIDTDLVRAVCVRPHVRKAMSAGELAPMLIELRAAGISQTEIAADSGLSRSQISRIASGKTRSPSLATIRALLDGLGISRSFAGLEEERTTEADTYRRTFLGTTLAAAAGAVLSCEPEQNDRLLLNTTTTYRQLEQRTPSRLLIDPVTSHLDLGRRLAARSTAQRRRRILTAVSESAGLAAWLHADLVQPLKARQSYRLAVAAAEKSNHPMLRSYMQASAGQYATASGDPIEGLRMINDADARLPRNAPQAARAWLAALHAIALSHLSDRTALRVIDRAERHAEAGFDDEPMWPWLFRFDARKVSESRATVCSRLGLTPPEWNPSDPATLPTPSPKQAALLCTERARGLIAARQVDEALNVMTIALDLGLAHESERVRQSVCEVRRSIPTSRPTSDLDERLHASYGADDS